MHSYSDRKKPGIKRDFLDLPDTLEGEQSYCITIPGGLSNKLILIELLQMTTMWFNWQRTDGLEAKQTADAWRDILNLPELNMCCCPEPTNVRYLADGTRQVSYDNGATWVTDNSLDDRYSGAISPPLEGPDGDDKKCIAATSAQEFIKANLIDSLSEGQTYAELTGALVSIVAVLGVTGVGLLLGAAVAAIFLVGVTAVQAAFTSEIWTAFRCILYCHIEDDGSFNEAGWEGVKADILSQFTGTVSAILYNWTNAAGIVGLTNAARSHFAASGDCSDCECVQPCAVAATMPFEYGTGLTYTFDTDTGITTITGSSEFVETDVYTVRWGILADSVADGCHFAEFTINEAIPGESYWYRIVGEASGTQHGPDLYATLITDAGPECLNLIQVNYHLPFTFVLKFYTC